MAMFGKEGAPRPESRSAGVVEASLSIIGAGMRIIGDVEVSGVLKVDGHIEGSVTGARQVLLGQGGTIHGNVVADEVVLGGTIEGAILGARRLELQASAVVIGDIETKSIVVLEGARISGVVRMSDMKPAAKADERSAKGAGESLRIVTGS